MKRPSHIDLPSPGFDTPLSPLGFASGDTQRQYSLLDKPEDSDLEDSLGGGPRASAAEELNFDAIDEDLETFQQDEIVREALKRGVNLREYSSDIDRELSATELSLVRDYMAESGSLVRLFGDIQSCDAILARMQELLLGFQADLGGISDEIRHLQEESCSMNVKLRNRREAEGKLKAFLDNVVLPDKVVETLCNGDVSDAYLSALRALDKRLRYASQPEAPTDASSLGLRPQDTAPVRDVSPELLRLRSKATSRIREWSLTKIHELMNPKTNVQMLQQNVLVKFAYCMEFLEQHASSVAREVRLTYVETMGRTVYNLFRQYNTNLLKLHRDTAGRHDLIAAEEAQNKSVFTSKVDLSKRADAFAVGQREQILDKRNVDAPPIIFHVAQAQGKKLPYEAIFRSVQMHLMNSATSEYLFTLEFFHATNQDMFLQIFAKSISLCLENLENYLFQCHDAIGLLLMIQIATGHRYLMQQRRVPVLDSYFDRVTLLLWPRFKAVFEAQLNSVSRASPSRLGVIEKHPHFVTRRYAEFASSILLLMTHTAGTGAGGATQGGGGRAGAGGGGGLAGSAGGRKMGGGELFGTDMLLNSLAQLRHELGRLLVRMAAELRAPRSQVIFLINNYDQVLSIFAEHRVASDDTTHFQDLLAEQRESYVEAELREYFEELIQFVLSVESEVSRCGDSAAAAGSPHENYTSSKTPASGLDENTVLEAMVNEQHVDKIVKDFAARWKKSLEKINKTVMADFSNFKNGTEVLKQVLTQLLLYYTRFQDIIRKRWSGNPPSSFSKMIVSTATILYEIKKYSRTF